MKTSEIFFSPPLAAREKFPADPPECFRDRAAVVRTWGSYTRFVKSAKLSRSTAYRQDEVLVFCDVLNEFAVSLPRLKEHLYREEIRLERWINGLPHDQRERGEAVSQAHRDNLARLERRIYEKRLFALKLYNGLSVISDDRHPAEFRNLLAAILAEASTILYGKHARRKSARACNPMEI